MSGPAHWTPRREPPTCWRKRGLNLCGRPVTGPAEVCAEHLAEMRAWSNRPAVTPRATPSQGPAVAVWLDQLEQQLDQAIRTAA